MYFDTAVVWLTIVPLLIALTGLASATLVDQFINKEQRRGLLIIVILLFALIGQNYFEYYLTFFYSNPPLRTLVAICGYSIRPFVIIILLYLLGKRGKIFYTALGLSIINTLIYLTALFSDIAFRITKGNHYDRGPLGFTSHIISLILLVSLVAMSAVDYYRVRKSEAFIPVISMLIVIFTVYLDFKTYDNTPVSFLTGSMVLCSMSYYIWLHLNFVRNHEDDIIKGQNVKLMLSQIQPHFIYNSLSSISELCETEPKRAQKLTDDFAEYLRYNFTAMTTEKLISFEKQLEQAGVYLDIEKERFGDRLNVAYDIKSKDFEIPTLTVQPLVENAVRHGICKHQKGGTVTIRTYETDKENIIEIIDNGVGFDTAASTDDNETHVGLKNVRTRLAYYGDTMEIKSKLNEGTTATIIVPKTKQRKGTID